MKLILVFVLSSFTFVDHSRASNVCTYLFDLFQGGRQTTFKVKTYDPLNADQQMDILLNGELKKLKKADPKSTHLPYFIPYVEHAILRLEAAKERYKTEVINSAVNELIEIAHAKMSSNQVTYNWILELSSKTSAIMDGDPRYGFRNLKRMQALFPHDIVIPTFAALDFRHFIAAENRNIALVGMIEEPQYVDGVVVPFTAEQFVDHDFTHYMLTQKAEKIVSSSHPNHRVWVELHKKIWNKIERLPTEKKRFVEFVYFYALHENYDFREALVKGYLEKNLAKAVRHKYRLQDIRDYYEGKTHIGRVYAIDLFKRMNRPNDFMSAFPNKNPQEILLVGSESFLQIANEIDMGF